MKSFKTFALVLLCVLSVCFFSCKGSASVTNEDEGFGISITLPGGEERAVFYDIDEVASYTIRVSQNGYDVASKNAEPGETVRIKLTDEGNYDISVSAFNVNNNKIAEGTASVTLALGDGYKNVEIDIYPDEKSIGINLAAAWETETPDDEKYGSADAVIYDISIYEGEKLVDTYCNVSLTGTYNVRYYSTYKIKIEAKKANGTVVGTGEATFTIQKGDTVKDVSITIVREYKLCCEYDIILTASWETPDEDKYGAEDVVRYDVSIFEGEELVNNYENVNLIKTFNVPNFSTYRVRIEAKKANLTVVGSGEATFTIQRGNIVDAISITIRGDYKQSSSDLGINPLLNWVEGYKRETVTFGSWPQSLADVTGITLTATGKTYDGNNAEYSGSDGNKYVKVDDSYYKVEPITWRVIVYNADGSKRLLADKIYARIPYYGTTRSRILSNSTIYANNYKYSNIRAYLNSTKNQFETDGGTPREYDVDCTNAGFLTSAFTSAELAKIKTVLVDNSAATTDSSTNQYACENTEDKVYLLSYKEASKNFYGLYNNSDRIMKTTAYARANGAYQSDDEGYGGCWWLRSPYHDHFDNARFVSNKGGHIEYYGLDYFVYSDNVGVVPALTVTE